MAEYEKCRAVPRYSCVGSAEILQNGSLCWGRLSDISGKGCYISTVHPLPVGTEVQLRLTIAGTVLETGAKVAWSTPGTGMGMFFVVNSPEDESKLAQILEEVGGTFRAPAAPLAAPPQSGTAPIQISREEAPEILVKILDQLNGKGVFTKQDLIDMLKQ